MLAEAFPRLAVHLRSLLPDADVRLAKGAQSIEVQLPNYPSWTLHVSGNVYRDEFLCIQTSLVLHYECLCRLPEDDFNRFIAAENLGLRGATIVVENSKGPRTLRIRTSFIGQKGRSYDEAENLAIDVVSLVRFARMLDDRIRRCTAGDDFSFELYYSTYLSKGVGHIRYINYARHIFKGSMNRVFGQVAQLFKEDHGCDVVFENDIAYVRGPNSDVEITLRVPEQVPMAVCSALLASFGGRPRDIFAFVTRLNAKVNFGHFEVSADGSKIFFTVWKHLTNDLRLYSLDQLLQSITEAQWLLKKELAAHETAKGEKRMETTAAYDQRSAA